MAKSSKSKRSSGNDTLDKLAKAAMSREMLAAGLAAAAAAISASPAARRKIRDAGLDAADTAQAAAASMVTNASKLGSLIAEAVADAAQRVLSGKWTDDGTPQAATSSTKRSARFAGQEGPRQARRLQRRRLRPAQKLPSRQRPARLRPRRLASLPRASVRRRLARAVLGGARAHPERRRAAPAVKAQAARSSNWSRASRA